MFAELTDEEVDRVGLAAPRDGEPGGGRDHQPQAD
jgi:hypothetical protein